jgi:hypothetical protein
MKEKDAASYILPSSSEQDFLNCILHNNKILNWLIKLQLLILLGYDNNKYNNKTIVSSNTCQVIFISKNALKVYYQQITLLPLIQI